MMKRISILIIVGTLVLGLSGTARATLITFDEYAEGTEITNQYQAQGVLFSGAIYSSGSPVISKDDSPEWGTNTNKLAPQGTSGTGDFAGDLRIQFTTPVTEFSFESGAWDYPLTGGIYIYDSAGILLTSIDPYGDDGGVQTISYAYAGGIGSIYFDASSDPAGATIDNLYFVPVPEPSTLLLFGVGLIGVAGLTRRLKK